jgi:hypothetical protein
VLNSNDTGTEVFSGAASSSSTCFVVVLAQRAEAVDEPHVLHSVAGDLEQQRACEYESESLSAGDGDVDAVEAEEEVYAARDFVAGRCGHRDEADRSFLALKFVNRSNPRT